MLIVVFIFYPFLKLVVQVNYKPLANNMNLDIIVYYNQIFSVLTAYTHTHTKELNKRQGPGVDLYRIGDGLNFEWTTTRT